jgi:hypothetical protein
MLKKNMLKKIFLFKNREKVVPLPKFTSNLNTNLDINIVVSRYNEDLNWINNEPFNRYFIICYNKGINDNFKINSPHKIVKLNNVGKCDHTYLYHIINNYDNLSDYIIFLPGSNNLHYKYLKSINLINYIEYYNKLVNIGTFTDSNIKSLFYNFKLNSYKTSHKDNYKLNNNTEIEKSKIRPFGKWYEHHFNNINVNFYTWWGIFAITKKIVHQHPKEYYEKLLEEINYSDNPEVGHYIERSWFAIFYPVTNCKFINHKYNMN